MKREPRMDLKISLRKQKIWPTKNLCNKKGQSKKGGQIYHNTTTTKPKGLKNFGAKTYIIKSVMCTLIFL